MIKLSDLNFRDLFTKRTLDHRFPSIASMERAAQRRAPKFAWDYVAGGIGAEDNAARNVSDFSRVRFVPKYLQDPVEPDTTTKIFGRKYEAPFGPGPVGLSGLMWPETPMHIARGAAAHGLPSGLSSVATNSVEEVGAIMGGDLWLQLYPMKDHAAEEDVLKRHTAIGGEVLMITVDVPAATRRQRDIGNGLSVPPRQDLRTYYQAATHPAWALETVRKGMPTFRTITRYMDDNGQDVGTYLRQILGGHVSVDDLKRYRELWKGKLIIKGVLGLDDVRTAMDIGADGIVVSNHGGRQLDAAPTAVDVLPQIRQLVGGKMAILVDGGVRTGLDIARYLALGADFVLLGRPLVFACAAMGGEGPKHALEVLRQEFTTTLAQIGCEDYRDLAKYIYRD